MTLLDRPRLQLQVGDRDVTDRADSITFSATDAGGFEIATLGLPAADRPKKGVPVNIRAGCEVAWQGRATEIADHSQHGWATKTTGCEGLVALMRDSPFSMIYVDRDLTRWQDPSTTRQVALVTANYTLGSSQAAPDQTSGVPAIVQTIVGAWVSPLTPICESWYDAGAQNLIAFVYYDMFATISGGAWSETVRADTDDTGTSYYETANLNGAATGYAAPPAPQRFYSLVHQYPATPAGVDAQPYLATWRKIGAYGNHGLPTRGPNPPGFYPSDIARHAVSQCAGIVPGTIIDATGYIVPHVVYRTPTGADQIVTDMAKLMGWTWGVWEPPTILGTQPRLDFRPPPTDATAVISKAECDQLDVTSRIGDLYNVAKITYTDPAGSTGIATVTLANPQLNEAGVAQRTLLLDIGAGSAGSAATFGAYALALSQIAARAAGQATLPVSVRLPGGGSKPSCLLRPGIDRLRIIDLTDGGPLLDLGTNRRDVFRISRTETTVAADGSYSTRVELDNGTNLLEVLQARLSTAVGFGASG